MNENMDALLRLEGTEAERAWLREHMETLSAREGTILAAALTWHPPSGMADVINHMLTLNHYDVCYQACSYKRLGESYLYHCDISKELHDFIDAEELGRACADKYPGAFVDGHYVQYHQQVLTPVYDSTGHIPKMPGWSVRLKLASEQVPGGLWIRLPDYDDINEQPGEIRMALDALRVDTVGECTLLDAKCILPEITDIVRDYKDYDGLIELICDGQNLGCLMDGQEQGIQGFDVRLAAAIEYERCRNLRDAVEIAQNLGSYDYVPALKLHEYAREELRKQELLEQVRAISEHFDYEKYAAVQLKKMGYQMTSDGMGYVLQRDVSEQTQESNMTMQ